MRQSFEKPIAYLVTVVIVDVLEIVDIEQNHRYAAAIMLGSLQFAR